MRLSTVQELKSEIEQEQSRLESLRASSTIITTRLDGLPRPTSQQSSRVEGLAVAVLESERRIAELADEYAAASIQLLDEIYSRIKNKAARAVLFKRYVLCKQFAEIATELGYSEANVYRLHRRGKNLFERTDSDDKNHGGRRRDTGGSS